MGKVRPHLTDMPGDDVGGVGGTGQQRAGIDDEGKGVVKVGVSVSTPAARRLVQRVCGEGAERIIGGGRRRQGDVGGYNMPGAVVGDLIVRRRRERGEEWLG